MYWPQIEDLSQQAQMAAAENFKRPEATTGMGDLPNTISQPIQEESEDEDEVTWAELFHIAWAILETLMS